MNHEPWNDVNLDYKMHVRFSICCCKKIKIEFLSWKIQFHHCSRFSLFLLKGSEREIAKVAESRELMNIYAFIAIILPRRMQSAKNSIKICIQAAIFLHGTDCLIIRSNTLDTHHHQCCCCSSIKYTTESVHR